MSESRGSLSPDVVPEPGADRAIGLELTVPAQPLYLSVIGSVVKWSGRHAGLSDEKCGELEVAVDEACTNVVRHAFPESEKGQMTVACSAVDVGLEVTLRDQGRPFDPNDGLEIARQKQAVDPASGGMGLSLIHQLTDGVHYQWNEQLGNCLILTKHK